jgi:hypothetical protein
MGSGKRWKEVLVARAAKSSVCDAAHECGQDHAAGLHGQCYIIMTKSLIYEGVCYVNNFSTLVTAKRNSKHGVISSALRM